VKPHRLTITTLVVFSLASLVPAQAVAGSSLLSGYGGPGQGSQAILGSTLLNGPKGAGAGGGSGSSPPASGGARSEGALGAPPAGGAGAGKRAKRVRGRSQPRQSGAAGAEPAAGAARPATSTAVAAAGSEDVGSQPLGLSGADFAYILLALAAVVLTGALTRRLSRQGVEDASPAQGMPHKNRVTR
jgi:hypothetical protein